MGRPKLSFESRVMPDPNSGCWLWAAGWDSDGYGLMTGNVKAHRYSFQIHHGEIPAGMCVCHRCDTPACVNPAHLFLGSHRDNAADRNAKGRQSSREKSPHAKLSEEAVAQIISCKDSNRSLAALYGVTAGAIAHVRHRRSWKVHK